jgi:hypothetical protein
MSERRLFMARRPRQCCQRFRIGSRGTLQRQLLDVAARPVGGARELLHAGSDTLPRAVRSAEQRARHASAKLTDLSRPQARSSFSRRARACSRARCWVQELSSGLDHTGGAGLLVLACSARR